MTAQVWNSQQGAMFSPQLTAPHSAAHSDCVGGWWITFSPFLPQFQSWKDFILQEAIPPLELLKKQQPQTAELDLQNVPFPAKSDFSASSSKECLSSVTAESGCLGGNCVSGSTRSTAHYSQNWATNDTQTALRSWRNIKSLSWRADKSGWGYQRSQLTN